MFEWLKKKVAANEKVQSPQPAPSSDRARNPNEKPEAKFKLGQHVRVLLNARNKTQREGSVRRIEWHNKDARYCYYLQLGGRAFKKRYFEEDLEYRPRPACECGLAHETPGREVELHFLSQDTSVDAWKKLLDLIEYTAANDLEEFAPGPLIGEDFYYDVVTLPPTIAKLKRVKKLVLYGSAIVRIPPEIGEMTALEEFYPYTSYRLHWLPYEITRCTRLQRSTVSTRALYGNYKYRTPFPDLGALTNVAKLLLSRPEACSVCAKPFLGNDYCRFAVWTTRLVATDVLPLLAYACSHECVDALPSSPEGYVTRPHRGGCGVVQAKARY